MTAFISKVKISETQDEIFSLSPAWQPSCWQSVDISVIGTIKMCKELEGEPDNVVWLDFLFKKCRYRGNEHRIHMPEK